MKTSNPKAKTARRFWSVLLSLVMALGMLPTAALAAEDDTEYDVVEGVQIAGPDAAVEIAGMSIGLPLKVTVQQGGAKAPPAETFEFELVDTESTPQAPSYYGISLLDDLKIETSGEGTFTRTVKFDVLLQNLAARHWRGITPAGSDQIWNPDLTDGLDLTFFGDFVKGRGKKISYAASIGKNILTECELKKMVQAIEYLDVVGVREVSAANLLQNNTEKDIYVNIDPTLLIDSKAWRRFITKRIRNDKYVFVYALEKNMKLINAAKQIAKRKNLNVVFLDMKNYYGKRGRSYYSAGPIEFLNLLYYADCVVTNSFHGTVFSMIFEKKFFSIPHKSRSTRVIDLLSELGLSDRVVFEYSGKENIDSPIDYKRVNELLSIKRKKSEKYFSDNLDIETR